MEDDLNFFKNERQPQYFQKWKTTLTYQKFKKTTSISSKMEENRKSETYFRIGEAL